MNRLQRWTRFLLHGIAFAIGGLAALALLLVAWIYLASASYEQVEDPERTQRKRAYLADIGAKGLGDTRPPNIVLILFDDLGFGDLGAYGAQAIATPNLDALAANGVRLTDYYSAAPVCSPARAGLLTGRYPPHTGLVQVVMTPGGSSSSPSPWLPLWELQRASGAVTHLPAEEITLAEVLQAAGYATGAFGKWHLGTHPAAHPNARGFDRFEGVMSSNDQLPNPFFNDGEIVEDSPVDQTTLTERYTRGAVDFIAAHRDEPFFVYLPHTFPHIPLHPSKAQRGKSAGGLYGDVVEDLDRSVGEVVAALRRFGIEERTLVVVTSDNGPWFQGSPGLRRGRKTGLFDGGFAVPFLASWPGSLPAGAVRSEACMGIDFFPTVLALADLPLPRDRVVDGRDILPLLRDGAPSPHEALSFYWGSTLGAVRSGGFKYHIRRPVSLGYAIAPIYWQVPKGPWLFDLERDRGESYDVSERHPEVHRRLGAELAARVAEDSRNPRAFLD